jgi:hypothetical protein
MLSLSEKICSAQTINKKKRSSWKLSFYRNIAAKWIYAAMIVSNQAFMPSLK